MSTYFLAATLAHAKPHDSLCLLLPGNWLEANYGLELRQRIWRSRRPVELTAFGTDEEIFPGTRVTATIAAIGPESDALRAPRFVARRATLQPDRVVEVEHKNLDRANPRPPPFGVTLWPQRVHSSRKGQLQLGELATVRRGVATGANDFFFLTDLQRSALPDGAYVRALRRLRHVSGDTLDESEHVRIAKQHTGWLLWLHDKALAGNPAVQTLLARAPQEIRSRELLRRRGADWFVVEHCQPPTILISTSARDAVRAVHNECGAIPSNSMYGIYLPADVDPVWFTNWWNSAPGQAAVLANARHYANGLLKLEPRDVLLANLPRPTLL